MKKLLLIIGIAHVFGTSAMAETKIGENYNMGCGEVSNLISYTGVSGVYLVELSISNGHTSGLVSDAGLLKEIQRSKLNKETICLGLEYDAEIDSNFISYFKLEK